MMAIQMHRDREPIWNAGCVPCNPSSSTLLSPQTQCTVNIIYTKCYYFQRVFFSLKKYASKCKARSEAKNTGGRHAGKGNTFAFFCS